MKIMSQRRWPINILYWIIAPVLIAVCYLILQSQLQRNGEEFLGYTDTQENQLKLDISAYVDKIHVAQGQIVKKGDLLLDLSKAEMDKDIHLIDQEIGSIREKQNLAIKEYQTEIDKINTDANQKVSTLLEEIKVEESKLSYAKSILSPNVKTTDDLSNPIKYRISALKEEMMAIKVSAQKLAGSYQQLIDAERKKVADINLLSDKKSYIIQEKNKLKILAPFDGIIGNVNIREQEYVERQQDLISFYEQSPSKAVGFIHESLSMSINVGDSLDVVSTIHNQKRIGGKVIGKGYRIVEIPERLRKIPQYKTYGMEIFIQLPLSNGLFQKEIIQLKTR
jgi:multidrug resistance efflux pump